MPDARPRSALPAAESEGRSLAALVRRAAARPSSWSGIAWLLVYYFSNGGVLGMEHLGGWNLAVGFAFIVGGLGMATQWK